MAELQGWSRFVALQLHYSLAERSVERELLGCAQALGLAVTAWSPLAGGVLTGKYAASAEERARQPGRLTTTGWGKGFLTDRHLALAETVRAVARETGRSSAQVALRWLMQRPGGVIPVIGVRSAAQLEDLLGATGFALDEAALATLEAASSPDLGYPMGLLTGVPGRRMVHGEHHDAILPGG
jgi:aryl-alcohol dehydrogenase-like predicted oxidoreductase